MRKYYFFTEVLVFWLSGFVVSAQSATNSFTDSADYIWKNSIGYLKDNSVIQGYNDGTFKPDKKINRAEFAKIIIGGRFASELNNFTVTSGCFSDTPAQEWYSKYVCLAKEKGIIGGYPDGTFQPDRNINQAEALKILLLAFQQPLAQAGGQWYEQYLLTARNNGMLYFAPNNAGGYEITRGEMAYFTAWLMSKSKGAAIDQIASFADSSGKFMEIVDGQTHVIKMPAASVKMNIMTGNNSIRPKDAGKCDQNSDCVAESQAESFPSFVNRSHKDLVVNGAFFDAYSLTPDGINYHQIGSDILMNGDIESMFGYKSAFGNGGMLAQMKNLSYKLYYPVRDWVSDRSTINFGISNYPMVLEAGHVRTKDEIGIQTANDSKFWITGRRGGLGISADGGTIYYVSTVGTVEDLGNQMLKYGVSSGFALDSGASNAFSLEGQTIFTPGRKLTSVIEFYSLDNQ